VSTCPVCGKENQQGFRFCGFCGAPLERPGTSTGMEERKVVSVLFCDLVGFTAASEAVDPEDVRARLRPYHELLRERIVAFGGTVEKFVGDAVMAVFGAPAAREDDAERAVRAGLAILESLDGLNASDAALGLSVRVGINTGEALVTLDARPDRGEGFVTGDVVNTASRIQGAAPVGGIAVGGTTFAATERAFEWEPLEPAMVKGKAEPVALWRPLRARSRFGTDVIREFSTPLVGRELELLQTRTLFNRVTGEQGVQLLTLVGEPGVGKSRIVAELFAYIDALPQVVRWRQGRCPPYGEGITFWALGEIVKAHAGILESDAPDEAQAKLEAVLPESDDTPWLRARLLPLLGIDVGSSVSREESFTAWRRFLESIADAGPTVLVFEDVHWADEALLAFLEHLVDWAQGVALLVVCTARPELHEKHPAWGAGLRNATTLSLTPLSDADTSRLVSGLLQQVELPAETQQLLLERAGGNPLYAEEFVRMLRDRELLDAQGRLRSGVKIAFPESLQALIAARLDTLSPDRKSLLQDAAVIGKVFWSGAVAVMGERESSAVDHALHELVRKELVRPFRQSSMEGEEEFGFGHVLVRDVAYGQVPRAQRAAKHAKAVAWLEGKAGERVEDIAEVLAYHTGEAIALAEAAGDGALAAELAPAARRYTLLAGERALGLDTAKALQLLERALELTPDSEPVFPSILARWADAAQQAGDFPGAAEALGRAVSAFREGGDLEGAADALALRAVVLHYLGDPGALADVQEAVTLLEPVPGPTLVTALGRLAGTHLTRNENLEAIEAADRAIELAATLGLPEPARALGFRGSARASLGDPDGLVELDRALELLLAQGNGRDAVVVAFNRTVAVLDIDGPSAAIVGCDAVIALAEARGIESMAYGFRGERITMLVEAGRLAETLAESEAVLRQLEAAGNAWMASRTQAAWARALCETGAVEEAIVLAERALDVDADSLELWLYDGMLAASVAQVRIAADRSDEARAVLAKISPARTSLGSLAAVRLPQLVRCDLLIGDVATAEERCRNFVPTFPTEVTGLQTARAQIAEARGEFRPAAEAFREASEPWRSSGSALEHAYAVLAEGRCLVALGDDAADERLREARRLFNKLGASPRVEECDGLLGQ
jgi:class 3 adenylate cyclase/tetratricopeptide (TPR) repeat protein